MKRPAVVAALCLTAASALALGLGHRATPRASAEDAQKAFEALKALEGTWVRADDAGEPTDEVASIFHVTAAGSALVETMMPGTDHEMVTIYYVEDDRLKMTHYCAMGNRPVLTCADPTEHEMSFACAHDDCCSPEMHMHAATITLVDADHLTTEWAATNMPDGEHRAVFHHVRQPVAPR